MTTTTSRRLIHEIRARLLAVRATPGDDAVRDAVGRLAKARALEPLVAAACRSIDAGPARPVVKLTAAQMQGVVAQQEE